MKHQSRKSRRSIASAASTLGVLAAATVPITSSLQAQTVSPTPVYDPLNYPTGNLHGNGAWQTTVANSLVQIDSTKNLDYTGLNPSKSGIAIVSNGSTGGEHFTTPTVTGRAYTLYYSMKVRITDTTGLIAGVGGTFFAGLNPTGAAGSTASGNAYVRVHRDPSDSTKWQFGIAKDTTATVGSTAIFQNNGVSYTADNTNEANNPTFFIVARYINGNSASLWINPASINGGADIWGAPETNLEATVGGTSGVDFLKASSGTDNADQRYFF